MPQGQSRPAVANSRYMTPVPELDALLSGHQCLHASRHVTHLTLHFERHQKVAGGDDSPISMFSFTRYTHHHHVAAVIGVLVSLCQAIWTRVLISERTCGVGHLHSPRMTSAFLIWATARSVRIFCKGELNSPSSHWTTEACPASPTAPRIHPCYP